MLIDASVPITEQDLRVISLVADSGRALVLAFNKWDLARARWGGGGARGGLGPGCRRPGD
uniref:hypothetical protein n=1 Tax=Nocardia neocaledoniensis TaxID=236511 RepID=UPI00245777CB